jgi:hypothetical protein
VLGLVCAFLPPARAQVTNFQQVHSFGTPF